MSWEAWLTLALVVAMLITLMRTTVAPDIVFMAGLSILLVAGVLSPAQALDGFANPGVMTVGVLYVVVTGLRDTGGIQWIGSHLLGQPRSLRHAQLRLTLPVSLLSAFLNNTPVVAMLIPAVADWGRKYRLSASKLMMPLSFAAILGGTCTLIGTSTNLVVNGLLIQNAGLPGLGMFELAWIGVPVALVGLGFMLLAASYLLPDRLSAISELRDAREYSVEMLVARDGPLVGRTISEAGLRHLPGMFLAEINRGDFILPAVGPNEHLQPGDHLIFVGVVDSVVELQKIRGLTPATEQIFKLDVPRPQRVLVEAVVSNSCPLTGKTIREGRFRTLYGAVVIAVARNGERIDRKIGDIVLRPGDTLLLETRPSFVARQRDSRDFFLISQVDAAAVPRHERIGIAVTVIAAMVLTVAVGLLSMLQAALIAAGLMLITRCCTGSAARRSIDWSVLVVIAAAIGIGNALNITGAAAAIAHSLLGFIGSGPWPALVLIYAITALFTAFITNNAAAVLMFPIAHAVAAGLNVAMMPFAIAIVMGASASFATPIGYQTNLMVYGPGGYRFGDYLRLGLPLNLVTGIVVVLLVPLIWPFAAISTG